MKNTICLAAVMTALLLGRAASGTTLNYDPNLPAPAPVLNAGWSYDQVNAANQDSLDSPYVYNLAAPAMFRITDQFLPGDVYSVYDFGVLILTTAFNGAQVSVSPIGDPLGDSGWTRATLSHGAVLLAAGAHDLTVQGNNGAHALPAGFFDRIDSVPDGGTTALMLGGACLGVTLLRRRFA